MSILKKSKNKSDTVSGVKLVTERGNGFYAWGGKIYQSDVVRAAIRPKVKAIGKLVAKHIRATVTVDGEKKIETNPEPYLRFLLEEPNPLMTGQMLQEKLVTQLMLNNNAFALIIRDENGFPESIYPIDASGCDAIYNESGELFLKFYFNNGRSYTFRYSDIIHLRQDFYDNDVFGTPITSALIPLMSIVSTTDQGIVNAIKNSSVVRWLLKFNSGNRPEDIRKNVEEFSKQYLSTENGIGAAGINANMDATQVTPNDYVPNAAQMDRTVNRIYALFNTNEKIVMSSRNENEWQAYFDSEIEPIERQLNGEYTRKIFSRKQRGFGNRIMFEASAWDCASIATKLALVSMVDRGALTPNEWRNTFNLAPVDGGDEPIRRLDTKPTTDSAPKGGES